MTKVDFIFLCIWLLIFGFIFGWIFPVEGPIDDVYDEAVKKKAPVKAAPIEKKTLNAGEVDMFIDDFGTLNIRYLDDNGEEQLIDILPKGDKNDEE